MTQEELTALREKIDRSPGLQKLARHITDELTEADERAGYGLDPLTILFIISVILQVISLCRQQRSEADVELDIANVGMLPPRKLMRLKRRLNLLWAKHCAEKGIEPGKYNPFFAAALGSVKRCQPEDIASIIRDSN